MKTLSKEMLDFLSDKNNSRPRIFIAKATAEKLFRCPLDSAVLLFAEQAGLENIPKKNCQCERGHNFSIVAFDTVLEDDKPTTRIQLVEIPTIPSEQPPTL